MNSPTTSTRQSTRVVHGLADAPPRFIRSCPGYLGLAFVALVSLAQSDAALAQTAPSLGANSTFGIVSSTFTNTSAATVVNGDVCYTTGPGTAYTLNGTLLVPCSAQNGADQNTALTNLNGQSCTSLGAGVVTLDTVVVGTNLPGTIPPGCYSSGGAMNITTLATVTLSGAGVYIFKSGGPLGIGASSHVNLANGACASRTFWAPVATTTLGASATFVGNIFDAAGITLGHLAVLTGRALAFGATITADANTITVPSDCDVIFQDGFESDVIFRNGFE